MPQLTEPNQIGKREDLSDLISNVDMHECPLVTMIPKGPKPKNALFEWQANAYDTPSKAGVVDGADVTTFQNKAANRRMLQGRIKRQLRSWKVSTLSEELSDVAGIKSEAAAAIAQALTELKRDMEVSLGSDDDSQADDGVNGYNTRGLGSWINNSEQSDLPVHSSYRTPAASIDTTAMASLTETILQGVLQSIWTQTGQRKRHACLCGPDFKRAISDFTKLQPGVSSSIAAIRQYNQDAKSGMIYATVDVFVGDFGELEFIPTKWLGYGTSNAADHRAYVLDMSQLQLRTLRNPGNVRLQDAGGGQRGYVDSIYALQCSNPLGLGKFAATS